ncbi:hypothetical protein, partial [Nostoc sp. MG11]|uniref:hypothetical protein n=1 Tax=Nostoc sp. MG11 TaxID=2721166 RepID=UPI001D031D69
MTGRVIVSALRNDKNIDLWRAKNFGGDEGHNTIRWLNVGFYGKSHISIKSGAVEHQPHDLAAYKS